jgi:hypothetical protein
MRLNRTTLAFLLLTALALSLTSPAAAAGVRNCTPVYATLSTTVVEEFVEVGPVEGTITGAAYLRYDDAAPPIDPWLDKPNFMITGKEGAIYLWVYSPPKLEGDTWWRDFEILHAEGTETYAGQRFILEIYGKCNQKEGVYGIEGKICPPLIPTK